MALEKFDWPVSGAPTKSWYPTRNPSFPEAEDSDDLGISQELSSGGEPYNFGGIAYTKFFSRTWQNLADAEAAAALSFFSAVGGDKFKFTDWRGDVWITTLNDFNFPRRPARGNRWSFAVKLRADVKIITISIAQAAGIAAANWTPQVKGIAAGAASVSGILHPVPNLSKIPVALRPNLRFYAPMTADLVAWSKFFNPTTTFVRNSPATYTHPTTALLASAAVDTPRFETPGMVFERAADNLVLRSSEIDHAAWQRLALSTISANAVAGPSGSNDFETIVEDSTNNSHFTFQASASFAAGSTLTFSIDLKQGTRGWAIVQLFNAANTNGFYFWVNLATGAVGTTTVVGAATATVARVVAAPNGYWRCSATAILDGSSTAANVYCSVTTGDTVTNYTGNGSGSIHAGNAQLEVGALPTSRIATGAATATRNADDLKIGEAGHLLPSAGTVILACAVGVIDAGADVYQLIDAVAAGGATGVEIVVDGNAVRARVYSGGATVANLTGGAAFTAGVVKKIGLAWAANDFRLVVDGVQVASDTSGAAPTALHGTWIFPAQKSDGSRRLIGHMRECMTFDVALSSADIITIHGGL